MGPAAARYRGLITSLTISVLLGLGLLAAGQAGHGRLVLAWFIPAIDLGPVLLLLPTGVLGGIDANLRRDSRSLPILAIAVAVSILWICHFVLFPGDIPGLEGQFASEATSWVFLLINLGMPFAVALALVQSARPLPKPSVSIVVTAVVSVAGAAVTIMVAFALAAAPVRTLQSDGTFSWVVAAAGVAGLIPAILSFALFIGGRRGDVRIAGGMLAALTFCTFESISLLNLGPRFTPSWYAAHVLALLPSAALLAGQLQIYVVSVRAEQAARAEADRVAERLRAGFELAVEMATQVDMEPLIRRLLEGARTLGKAERASLVRIEDGMLVLETGLDSGGLAAPTGFRNSFDSAVSDGVPIILEAIRRRRAVISGPYTVAGLPAEHQESLRGLRHTLSLPLVLRGEVIAVIMLGRRTDPPFTEEDSDRLRELTVISALLLRNARLLDSAQEASAAKSRFLNMAAHELRTPLSVISGYIDMLMSGTFGDLDHRQEPTLRILSDKSGELASHVERLLVASRLDAGTSSPVAREVDLREIAADAVHRVEPRAALIGGRLEFKVPEEPVVVAADPADIGLVLDNLLNNALTYSQPPPKVTLSLTRSGELRVADHGIGISPEQQERVFEQFHRVENPDFGYPPGTGLGLYISRRLAERNGGSLVLEKSVPDAGSTFLLTLGESHKGG